MAAGELPRLALGCDKCKVEMSVDLGELFVAAWSRKSTRINADGTLVRYHDVQLGTPAATGQPPRCSGAATFTEVALAAPKNMTESQRTLRARLAAHTRWANEDPSDQAKKAQAGLLAKFEREVDPNLELPPEERRRRAESARQAHMTRLALRSSQARSRRGGDAT